MPQSRSGKLVTIKGNCPICCAATAYDYRPFCSRRCADVDLSRWLRGAYAIPVLTDEDEDGDSALAAAEAQLHRDSDSPDESGNSNGFD